MSNKAEKMKKKSEHTMTPKLRFPEFRNRPYRSVRLGDVAEDATERNNNSLDAGVVMGVFKGQGMLPMEQRLVAKDLSRYKIVKTDYFAYNPMRLNIGSIARWSGDESVLVSPDYMVFRCLDDSDQNLDPNYLDQFRYSDQWNRFVNLSGDGSVRVRIYFKDLARLRLLLPSLAEQQKIADCLSSLDGLIAAEGRKLEALRAHKKGLMQQLFPQPGQSQPRLRFPEFRDKEAWRAKKLGQAATFFNGRAFRKEELLDKGKYKVLRVGNFFTNDQWYHSDLELDDNKYCKKGDLLYAWSASFGPRIWHGERVIYHYHIWKVVEGEDVNKRFLFVCLDRETERMKAESANGLGLLHITKGTIENWDSVFPEIDEQKRIADFFSNVDALIAAQATKVEILKQHKHGLMQQLFPAPEEQ